MKSTDFFKGTEMENLKVLFTALSSEFLLHTFT